MCKYCEKGQRIKANDGYPVSYIHWEDGIPTLRTVVRNGWWDESINLKIIYCPFCGKDLIHD